MKTSVSTTGFVSHPSDLPSAEVNFNAAQMRNALEQRLVERWPAWLNTQGDARNTAMVRGFEHGDGWLDILWQPPRIWNLWLLCWSGKGAPVRSAAGEGEVWRPASLA